MKDRRVNIKDWWVVKYEVNGDGPLAHAYDKVKIHSKTKPDENNKKLLRNIMSRYPRTVIYRVIKVRPYKEYLSVAKREGLEYEDDNDAGDIYSDDLPGQLHLWSKEEVEKYINKNKDSGESEDIQS